MSTKLSSNKTTQLKGRARTKIAIKRGLRLRFLRGITGMVTEPFSVLCGVGRTTISSWEQGINPLTERGAEKVVNGVRAEGIYCTVLWLLHNIGEPPKIIDQDKLSKLNYHTLTSPKSSVLEEALIDYVGSDLQQEIELFKVCYSEHLIYYISDNTMHPGYRTGDWVGGIVLSQEALDLAHDMDCIVQLKNGTVIARRVKVETLNAFKLSLYGTNAETSIEYPPFRYLMASQITALAPIIRIWRNNLQATENSSR
jgi:transcriptional regulator with XRE-family HTH domain